MASSIESTNSSLEALSNSYVKTEKEEDPLGRDSFLTMLVAQLKHQDPLNPLEGTDFTAQLAQFSGLEQQFDMNDNLEQIISTLESRNDPNLIGYIGKEISGAIDSIDVYDGHASTSGYFTLSQPTGVVASIYNSDGEIIKRMNLGQLDPGTHSLRWDGTNNDGAIVDDGTYSYTVTAMNSEGGESYAIPTTVSGEVDGVVYKGGIGYLTVGDALVNPASVVEVTQPETVAQNNQDSGADQEEGAGENNEDA